MSQNFRCNYSFTFFSCFLLSLASQAAIFGESNILDIAKASGFSKESQSIAVAVLSANHQSIDSKQIEIDLDSLEGIFCPSEPFAGHSSLSYACTGFLVAPDLLVTAGHCASNVGETKNETGMYCEAFQWLFGYESEKGDGLASKLFPVEDFYRCRKIIYAVREESFPFRDFALIQLDRPVKGRSPLNLAKEPVKSTEKLAMLGHPWGTPLKLTNDGEVLVNAMNRQQFLTNLDAFSGNSGSPVLNEKKEVVGILIGGTPSQDRVPHPQASCQVLNRCDSQGKNCLAPDKDTSQFPGFQGVGSEVQRLEPILQMLEALKLHP